MIWVLRKLVLSSHFTRLCRKAGNDKGVTQGTVAVGWVRCLIGSYCCGRPATLFFLKFIVVFRRS